MKTHKATIPLLILKLFEYIEVFGWHTEANNEKLGHENTRRACRCHQPHLHSALFFDRKYISSAVLQMDSTIPEKRQTNERTRGNRSIVQRTADDIPRELVFHPLFWLFHIYYIYWNTRKLSILLYPSMFYITVHLKANDVCNQLYYWICLQLLEWALVSPMG